MAVEAQSGFVRAHLDVDGSLHVTVHGVASWGDALSATGAVEVPVNAKGLGALREVFEDFLKEYGERATQLALRAASRAEEAAEDALVLGGGVGPSGGVDGH